MQSTTNLYQLNISVQGSMKDFANILVYNGFNEIAGKGWGRFSQQLPRGLYRVCLAINEYQTEKMIRLDKDVSFTFDTPPTFSSVVAEGFQSTHEYYSANVVQWSKSFTTSEKKATTNTASLFLFFRYPNDAAAKQFNASKKLGALFSLLNSQRELIFVLTNQEVVKADYVFGWMAFHAPLPEGQYYLHYEGEPKREFPLYVFKNWQTQVFLTYGEQPIFESIKILFGKANEGFAVANTKNQSLEAILQKLSNGIYYIPKPLVEEIAYGKWEHPMLAIVGAYVYLHNEQETTNDQLFNLILTNLEKKILCNSEAPDIIALKILYAVHLKQPYTGPSLKEPCMLLAGMKAAIKATVQNPGIIPSKSIAESVIMNLYEDTVWTSYVPAPIKNISGVSNTISNSASSDVEIKPKKLKNMLSENKSTKQPLPATEKNILNSWVTSSVLNYLESNQKSDINPDINKLAEQLQVTPGIIAQSISSLHNFFKQNVIAPTNKSDLTNQLSGQFKASDLITGHTMSQVQSMLKNSEDL